MTEQQLHISLIEGINNTPALGLAVRGWAECTDKGWGDGTMNAFAGLHAFLGSVEIGRDLTPVGVITFDFDQTTKRVWIYQSFVELEYRGRGIYRAMFEKLCEHAILNLKARIIEYGTHVKNHAMRAVSQKLGCIEECVVIRMNLPG